MVREIYLTAWKHGCKGITIYRDSCREGVLVSNDVNDLDRPMNIVDSHAPKRPNKLECDVHRVNVKGEQYLVFVGLLNNRPYEVFAGLSECVEVPKKAKKGILVKNGRKEGVATYNLKIPYGDDDEIMFKDVVNLFDNPAYGALTRTISLALRHGVPIQYLVEQLRKDRHSDFTSFSNVIARVLSKAYVKDGTKATFEKTCELCGSTKFTYQQGCPQCMGCGNGKCG
jgi:ribonucleoside-diphosphate reductase alpha chain